MVVDRANRTVYVYHPGVAVETLLGPAMISGDPELSGLVVNTARVFQTSL